MFGLERDDSDAGAEEGADAKDGCWTTGEDGDEDLDLIVDGCDQCPADVDAAPADKDGDLVGDQCDPANGPANHIIAFDGFSKAADWNQAGGVWMRTNEQRGEFSQILLAQGFAYAELTVKPAPYPTIDVRFTPDSSCLNQCGAGGELVFPGVRVACIYEYRNGDDQVSLYVNEQMAAFAQFNAAAGAMQIQLSSISGGTVQCQAFSGGPSGKVTTTVSVPAATTKVGLITKMDSARFQSVLVISSP